MVDSLVRIYVDTISRAGKAFDYYEEVMRTCNRNRFFEVARIHIYIYCSCSSCSCSLFSTRDLCPQREKGSRSQFKDREQPPFSHSDKKKKQVEWADPVEKKIRRTDSII